MAMHDMRLILASVVQQFNFELYAESQDWLEQKSYALWTKGPLFCKISAHRTGEVISN